IATTEAVSNLCEGYLVFNQSRSVQGPRPAQRTLTRTGAEAIRRSRRGAIFSPPPRSGPRTGSHVEAWQAAKRRKHVPARLHPEQHQPDQFGRGRLAGKMPADSYRPTHLRVEAFNRVGAVWVCGPSTNSWVAPDPLSDGWVCGAPWHRYLPSI